LAPARPPILPMGAARSEADKFAFLSDAVFRYGPLIGFSAEPPARVSAARAIATGPSFDPAARSG
jgi:hypothetical protein